MNKFAVYVHIPFCEQKCLYCDFASFVCPENVKKEYVCALIDEINSSNKKGKVSSIYFGGGTPSVLDEKDIGRILEALRNKFDVLQDAEITIECNPNSTTYEKLLYYKNIGINRISFGVQSLQNNILKKIGRLHNDEQAINAILMAQKAGFDNISVDLIIGLMGQTKEKLVGDAEKLVALGINHISTYMLQVEKGTPLFDMVENKEIVLPNDNQTIKLYEALVKGLKKLEFKQYEISNFAKDKMFSKHNMTYWKRSNYLGFGLAAHSFWGRKRWSNSKDMKKYLAHKGKQSEMLSKEEIITEIIMLGLRCDIGVNTKKLLKLGYDITQNSYYKNYIENKILLQKGSKLLLNKKYYGVSNTIICNLLLK